MIKNLKNKKKKGFTLIELIIVIAILAILAAVAVPQFGKIRQNANRSTDIANAKTISNAIATLLAEDKITLPTSGEAKIYFGTGTDDLKGMPSDTEDKIVNYLQATPTPKMSQYKNSAFKATITTDGKITIFVNDSVQVYPEMTPATNNVYYPIN